MRYLESPKQASYALSENMEGGVGTTFGFSLCAMPLLVTLVTMTSKC